MPAKASFPDKAPAKDVTEPDTFEKKSDQKKRECETRVRANNTFKLNAPGKKPVVDNETVLKGMNIKQPKKKSQRNQDKTEA